MIPQNSAYIHHMAKSSLIPEPVYLNETWANTPTERVDLFNKYLHSVYLPEVSNVLLNTLISLHNL